MPTIVQLKRRVTAPVDIATITPTNEGEPLLAALGFTGVAAQTAPGYELVVDTGAGFAPMIGPQRQVEVFGNQTINGDKIFEGVTRLSNTVVAPDCSFILDRGAQDGAFIEAHFNGANRWRVTLANNSVESTGNRGSDFSIDRFADNGDPIDSILQAYRSDGVVRFKFPPQLESGAPVGKIYLFNRGLTETTTDNVDLDFAGAAAANLGGVYVPATSGLRVAADGLIQTFPASQAEATAGTDAAKPITSNVLKLGADPASLVTIAKTIVPAINELVNVLTTAVGLLQMVGTMDATTGIVTPLTAGAVAAGPLPVATAAMSGWFVLVSVPGTPPAGNVPSVPMAANDMVVCVEVMATPGTYAWAYAKTGYTVVSVFTDGISITGDGTSTNPLTVSVVDGGTF